MAVAVSRARRRGAAPILPGLRVHYADFARWQRASQETADARRQLRACAEQLTGAPPLELATDRPRPRVALVEAPLARHIFAFVWLPRDMLSTQVREQVQEIIGQGQQAPSGHIPFTPRAKKVLELSLREALERREASMPEPAICDRCNLRGRYGPRELLRVAWGYAQARLAPAA